MRSTASLQKNYLFWSATFLGLVLDRASKLWVVTTFALTQPPETVPLIPSIFHITYVTNSGAAFSLFSGGVWLRWISLIVSAGLVWVGLYFKNLTLWDQLGFGFLLGGAAGNGIDRFIAGHVVDFLDFRLIQFPIFNLADIFINMGLVCLFIGIFQSPKPPQTMKRQ